MVHAHAQDALTRQVDAARTPQQRAAAWRAVRQLCAAAECLLRLAPKLPREGTDEAAVLSPAGVHADAACGLAETAFMAAEALRGGAAMQPGRRFPSEPAASEAAADDAAAAIADLGFTLSKRALLWASRPAAQLDECTRDLLGPSAHGKTSEAADRYARETVLILLRSSYTAFCCSYCSGKEETSFDSLKCAAAAPGGCGWLPVAAQLAGAHSSPVWPPFGPTACRTLLPLVHTLAAAAEALSASLPADVRGEVAEMLRGIAQTMAVGADSQLIRPDPSGQCPPSVVELLLWADRPCAHVRCTTLRGAGERALKGRLCSGCRKARFCGDACARAGWRQHKEACKWVQQNREAAARGEEGVS